MASNVADKSQAELVINIGDRIFFSAALLQQIHDQPGHLSVPAYVQDILSNQDGTKTILLSRELAHDHASPAKV